MSSRLVPTAQRASDSDFKFEVDLVRPPGLSAQLDPCTLGTHYVLPTVHHLFNKGIIRSRPCRVCSADA
jgi:hypothetical protein